MRFFGVFFSFLIVLGAASPVWAGEPAESLLARHGYPPDQYQVILQWDELTPGGDTVTGYRIQPAGGGVPFERYALAGAILEEDAARQLGILSKRWNEADRSAAAHPAPGETATKARAALAPLGLSLPIRPADLTLPPADTARAMAEDRDTPTAEKEGHRIGIFVDLAEALRFHGEHAPLGDWQPIDGGVLLQFSLSSPGATGQRVHIAELSLPEGARLLVYNPQRPEEAFDLKGSASDTWLPSVFSETVVAEVYVPTGSDSSAFSLEIDRIAHIYAPLSLFQKANAGGCNLDVSCFPDWADTALGVCGLGTIGNSGALFCTGTLISDTDDCSMVPYVLTANHCVGGQTGTRGASNLEFYWFYQTPACSAPAPGIATVPRTTGGADYLAGSGGTGFSGGGNDFTLLRMRNTPPGGMVYVGWTTASPPLGTPVACIHHPRGDYKRYSSGSLTNNNNTHAAFYHQVVWTAGTTEGGSSGSPLMLASSQQIIGQLWGGDASCVQLSAPDYYGRFSLTLPIVAQYLDGGATESGFSQAVFGAIEGNTSVLITLSLNRPAGNNGLEVNYQVSGGSAVPGVDFVPTSGTATFAPNASTTSFSVALLDDLRRDDGKTVLLSLSDPSCGVLSPSLQTAQIVITDDDLDSDGDGISDYDEINGFFGVPTDPNNADTDGDGLTDYEELLGVYGYFTDPLNPDTDGDGVPDYLDLLFGGDPTEADLAAMSSLALPRYEESRGK